jgi:glycine/D-amino acid oxidase-like deaminating enzyme
MTPDVLIVGAGVIGASTAFHLARAGVAVDVVERAAVGAGMSGRSSALIRMHYTFPPEVELAVRSDAMFDAWPELVGRPAFVRRTGFVRIVRPGEEDQLRANVAAMQALGAGVELVDGEALAALAPGLRTDDVTLAAWEPHGGCGDGALVAGDFLAAARAAGAAYHPGTMVTGLVRDGQRVVGVSTPGGVLRAGTVVIAANVWSPPILRSIGVELPIETELHRVAHLRHAPGAGAPVAVIDSVTSTYFRPEGTGFDRTLVGDDFSGTRGVDPDEVPPSGPADLVIDIVEAAARRVPGLAEAGITGATTGALDMTPDGRPLLGPLPGWEGLVLATGLSGTGFKVSPAIGEAVAARLVGTPADAVDLMPFRPGRFEEGQPIHSPHPYGDEW